MILVLNVGSSSVKYKVYDKEKVVFRGKIDRIKTKKGYSDAIKRIFLNLDEGGIKVKAIGDRKSVV